MTSFAHAVGRRKIVAVLAVLAFGCASVGGMAHRAAVQHVACEHGQLVEIATSVHPAPSPRTRTWSHAGVHDHHHCALDGFVPPALRSAAMTSVAFEPSWRSSTVSVVLPEHAPLVYAPKTSPPV